jgi:hypothetical protein
MTNRNRMPGKSTGGDIDEQTADDLFACCWAGAHLRQMRACLAICSFAEVLPQE